MRKWQERRAARRRELEGASGNGVGDGRPGVSSAAAELQAMAAELEEADEEEAPRVKERARIQIRQRGDGGADGGGASGAGSGAEEDGEEKRPLTAKERRLQQERRRIAREQRRRGLLRGDGRGGGAAPAGGDKEDEEGDKNKDDDEDEEEEEKPVERRTDETLMARAARMRDEEEANPELAVARHKAEEQRLLRQAQALSAPALISKKEVAKGIERRDPVVTTWRPPRRVVAQGEERHKALREKWHILTEGVDLPPPIKTFEEMRFPPAILRALESKGIQRPTPIQVQGIPTVLGGRDMIGIAFTGSGKTLVFALPLIMFALEEEKKIPLARGEGPVGIIMCPARELARQTFEVVEHYCNALRDAGYPEIRPVLIIGGEDGRQQMSVRFHCFLPLLAAPPFVRVHLTRCRLLCRSCNKACTS